MCTLLLNLYTLLQRASSSCYFEGQKHSWQWSWILQETNVPTWHLKVLNLAYNRKCNGGFKYNPWAKPWLCDPDLAVFWMRPNYEINFDCQITRLSVVSLWVLLNNITVWTHAGFAQVIGKRNLVFSAIGSTSCRALQDMWYSHQLKLLIIASIF